MQEPATITDAHRSLGAILTALLLSACGGPAPQHADAPPPAPHGPVSELERYFPAGDGMVYAYETSIEETGERGVLMLQVTRPRPHRADLSSGRAVQRLAFSPEAIEFLEGGFLLKAPLIEGARWRGRMGQVRLEKTDEIARVPAGTFADCIATVEEASSTSGSRRVTSVFCRDVGLVRLDVEAVTDEGPVHESAELRSFGPRVDLGAAPDASE